MKAIMVMFDSLNRHMLPCYGADWVHAPNFARLAQRTVTFDRAFVGSMPCMPARRELHTGRYNFLHRSWGPVEPFDDSVPELLKRSGIHTHLTSDHYHYWEEGGCNYHTRYSTWDTHRGQEGDPWIADLNDPDYPRLNLDRAAWGRQDWINRYHMRNEQDQPQAKTFRSGLEFIDTNAAKDNWFLQIETFDPHEPFFCGDKYRNLYDWDFSRFPTDWPHYRRVGDAEADLAKHYRYCQAALTSMCDEHLGKVLDAMDRHDLWKDTMLIVCTDHGFLLGEHDWFSKCVMPFYNEVAHSPFFVWDPRVGNASARRSSLVQIIDWGPTLMEYFGQELTPDMQGRPLRQVLEDDTPVRQAGLFGVFGAHVNVTDGRYVYMRAPAHESNGPLYEYTFMPTHMRRTFHVDELKDISLGEPFSFTKGCRTMKIPSRPSHWNKDAYGFGTLLFDMEEDPGQERPLHDDTIERVMIDHLVREMKANDAPPEQFARLGLTA